MSVVHVGRGITMWDRACPDCGLALHFAVETPPIPMTFYSWFDPDGEGHRLVFCPRCDFELPDKDWRPSVGCVDPPDACGCAQCQ